MLNTVHILERLSCESCDYVRTTSNNTTQGLSEKRESGDETRIKVVIMT